MPIFSSLLFLQSLNQFQEPVFDFVMKFIQFFVLCIRDLLCLPAAFVTRMKFATRSECEIQIIQVFF
jgi:hypothetical protein